ncbi:hypothetical protein P8452_51695 [Trifolium repens]|nr:hypothetical protein P8452_51695 [Trifolium repens]
MVPQFQQGGGVENSKVWTKRSKRARGTVSISKESKEPNNSGIMNQPPKLIEKQTRQPPLQLVSQVSQDQVREIHLKPPKPNDSSRKQPCSVQEVENEDEMVVETPLSHQGFASKKSRNHVHELISRYKPDLVILVETHIAFSAAESFWNR